MKKAIVVYFSYSGHTKRAAEMIARQFDYECVPIKKKKPYSKNPFIFYKPAEKEVKTEQCPEIIDDIKVDDYDVIILGTPIWWDTMAPPVRTFLITHNLSGKTILPFCTHGGSGTANLGRDAAKCCRNSHIGSAFAFSKRTSSEEIAQWLNKN